MNCFLPILLISLASIGTTRNADSAEKGIAAFYSDQELIPLEAEYRKKLNYNFKNILLAVLPSEKKEKLKGVTIEVPLRIPSLEPNGFYSDGLKIVMSTASMKYWSDMISISIWLSKNNYSSETMGDYALMMKYSGLNKLDILNDDVKTVSDKEFASTMTFILSHELGHIYYGHGGYGGVDFEQMRRNESQADEFAIETMARVGDAPDIITYFSLGATSAGVPGDFPNKGDYDKYLMTQTHPLFHERLAAIGNSFRKDAKAFASVQQDASLEAQFEQIGSAIGLLAAAFDNPMAQDVMATRAKILTADSFGPRKVGETIPKPCVAVSVDSSADFSGTYTGKMTYLNSDREFDTTYNLVRKGSTVTGSMLIGVIPGKVDGLVEGDNLYFKFQIPIGNGNGVLKIASDGRLVGTWGDKESANDGGGLELSR
jgi:hypothetical protein